MKRIILSYVTIILLLLIVTVYAAITGSISVGVLELIEGLIYGGNEEVDVIKDLRFPRIIVALYTGATLAVSGVLLQAVMKNPLAEAGILGISAGGHFVFLIIVNLFPLLYFWSPLFSFIGGALTCFLVYILSWKSGLQPIRMVLVGVALNAAISGLNQSFIFVFGYSSLTHSGVSTLSMKTWSEVEIIAIFGTIGLILSLFMAMWCNILSLQDKTATNLGFHTTSLRIIVSIVAVWLAVSATSVAGVIAFVGLLVPHISRLIVGSNHKVLIPFSIFTGAFVFLLADTLGRTLIYPNEIPASVIMAVIGGPFLIYLLRKSDKVYGS